MASPDVQKGIDNAKEILHTASRPGIGTSLRRARIGKALVELHTTQNKCQNEMDTGFYRTTLLAAQCAAMNDLSTSDMVKQDLPQVVYQMEEMVLNWTWLVDHPQYQTHDSIIQVREALGNLLNVHTPKLGRQDILQGVQNKIGRLSRSCKDPFISAFRLEVTHIIMEECFHQAIRLFEAGKWAPAMSLLQSKDSELDVLVELEERYFEQDGFKDDYSPWGVGDTYEQERAASKRRDFDLQMAMCKGSQLIHTGDLHFKDAMNGDPDDMMSRALLAQDDYRAALGWITGHDVELEGQALTRLARFHAKVAKMPAPAHALYMRAVQLAAALQPALPKGDWYKEATDAIQAHRNALEAEEAKKWEKAREPILQKLLKDTEKLNEARNMDDAKFAAFIYKTWPPKTEGPAEPPSDPENPNSLSKKHLLKVIQRYHGDKNLAWGDEWRVMSEEISKRLTGRYNIMKGV
ncbi:hypothetical protein M408DRAFT_69128 [Serendipita vermifera MAFF 305830]|uniref:Uncharacterized protein n=1 Tax=Serendipita vermifera MAFF 305830 TaxID=933852 RepID=A0A0C2XI30_SERVB|nr:hypothetical protein M408DRAFT_69128 [Serendipita vermifera MAFF 305830]